MNDNENFSTYTNEKGIIVPRVNEILKYIGDSTGLCLWSNFLGFKRKKYLDELNMYSEIGTYAHGMINNYINNLNDEYCLQDSYMRMGNNAYNGFKLWFDDICKDNKVEVILSEESIVGDNFGGTLDALLKINDKIYIVDFKTSSSVKFSHFLQLSAYKILLKEVKNIEVNGLIVIKSDRNDGTVYNEHVIHYEGNGKIFIDKCEETFKSAHILYNNYKECENIFNERGYI